MSALVGEWLGNLCFTGPCISSGDNEGKNNLSVNDDADLLLDYGELDLLDVDAILDLQRTYNTPDSSNGFSHFDNSLSNRNATPSTHNNIHVINAINSTTSFFDLFQEPTPSSASDGVLPPSSSSKTSHVSGKPPAEATTTSASGSRGGRSRTGSGGGGVGKEVRKASSSLNSSTRSPRPASVDHGDSSGGKEGKKSKTVPSAQTALLYSPCLPGKQSLPPSFPVYTTTPCTLLAPTTTFCPTLAFTTAPLIPAVPSTVTCPPHTFTAPPALPQTTGPFNPGLAFPAAAFTPSYPPSPMMNPNPTMKPTSIFAQTPAFTVMPEAGSHSAKSSSRLPGSRKDFSCSNMFSSARGAKGKVPAGWLGSESLYSGRRAATSYSVQRDIEDFRDRVHMQKVQRRQAASAGDFSREKMKRYKTVFNSHASECRPEPNARSAPYQQSTQEQKKQQQRRLNQEPQRPMLKQPEEKLVQKQDKEQQKLLKQQQQQLTKLLQQHAKQRKELHDKQRHNRQEKQVSQKGHKRRQHHKDSALTSGRVFPSARSMNWTEEEQRKAEKTPSQRPRSTASSHAARMEYTRTEYSRDTPTEDSQGTRTDCSQGTRTDCSLGSRTDCSLGTRTDCSLGTRTEYSCSDRSKEEGEVTDVELEDVLFSCSQPTLSSSSPVSQMDHDLEVPDSLYHFDGYRMAPAQNDAFDFFMAETTCSDAQSDTEDSNLDSLLQQFKSPSYQEPQQCLSDVCNVSDTAEGFDLMCDQSSSQLTIEDNVSRSIVTSASGACELSPGQSSVFNISPSPLSVSNASVAATAGTHCDLNWPSVTDDESVTEVCSSPHKGEKRKASPGASPGPRRQAIPNYQTMTPWTNDNLDAQGSFPSPNREIPCFPLDAQSVREQSLNSQSPMPSSSQLPESCLRSTAVTETVYSLTSSSPSLSVHGHAQGQSLKRSQSQVSGLPHGTREKRFRKTAEALQKCGLWDIAMKTGNLIKRNAELQKEIDRFRSDATVFLKAVVQNPENKELMESLSRGVPLTLRQKVRATHSFKSDAVTTTACTTSSQVSDCNSSTTSGYASYTEGGSKQTSPSRK